MTPTETAPNEPDDADVRYDLAGNPLPPTPKPAASVPPIHFAPGPSVPPAAPPAAYIPPGVVYAPAAKSSPGPLLFVGLGTGLLVLIGLVFGLRALLPKPVTVPKAYTTYTAIDSSFTCDQPGGWTLHETGATNGNLATATFQSGPARVRIVSDATGSLMADTMSSSNAGLPPEQQIPAVQKLHTLDQKQLADTLPGYKEGDAQKFTSAAGDARVSEWTASGSLHGYRVTMLGREREFTVICLCPEHDWKGLMPAFQRIIGSVKPGNPS